MSVEQFTYCREQYRLAGVTKLQPKNILHGHKSACNALANTLAGDACLYQKRQSLMSAHQQSWWCTAENQRGRTNKNKSPVLCKQTKTGELTNIRIMSPMK